MIKVLWISRHTMTADQTKDLARALNDDFSVIKYDRTVCDISELLPFIGACDVIAAVLPIELLAALFDAARDKPVIIATSKRIATGRTLSVPDGSLEYDYAFVHDGWRRIIDLKLKTTNFIKK